MSAKEYFEIQAQIEVLQARKDALRDELIAKGTHSEKGYVCVVTHQSRRSLSLSSIEKFDPRFILTLDQAGLIKTNEVSIVKVSKKGA